MGCTAIHVLNEWRLRWINWTQLVIERVVERVATRRFTWHRNRVLVLYDQCYHDELPWALYAAEKARFIVTWEQWYKQTWPVSPYLHDRSYYI